MKLEARELLTDSIAMLQKKEKKNEPNTTKPVRTINQYKNIPIQINVIIEKVP